MCFPLAVGSERLKCGLAVANAGRRAAFATFSTDKKTTEMADGPGLETATDGNARLPMGSIASDGR